jgi:hypothetical protein
MPIYYELIIYAALLIVCGLIICTVFALYFLRKKASDNIRGFHSQNLLRNALLILQLIIGLTMIFCATVFIKQMHFLHTTDLGISRHNIVGVNAWCCPLPQHYAQEIKKIPGIVDAIPIDDPWFLMGGHSQTMDYEKDGEKKTFTYNVLIADERFFDFYEVKIIEGTSFANDDTGSTVYNEATIREIGEDALAHARFHPKVGIAVDFHISPTTKARPMGIYYPGSEYAHIFRAVAYKYEDGMRQQTQDAVRKWFHGEFPNHGEFEINFIYLEDLFDEQFKSENVLLRLISIMTLVSILIAIFGVYSLTSLTCKQRRKEIAIRKVHGAEIVDIMNIFFKKYIVSLGISAAVAFPTGYLIMKTWIENYVKQTSIDAWIYIAIFLLVFIVIVFSIFSIIWQAARRDPAEVVKSE